MSPHRKRLRERRKERERYEQLARRAKERERREQRSARDRAARDARREKARAARDARETAAPGGKVRPRRRWWQRRGPMLALSAPVWIVMLASGGLLLEQNGTTERGLERYAEGMYLEATSAFREVADTAVPGWWRAFFNHGTAATREAHADGRSYWGAINAFDEALRRAGENRCVVQPNRAIAYELQGDHEMASHDEHLGWAEELRALEEAGEELPEEPEWGEMTVDEILEEAFISADVAGLLYEYAAEARSDPECPPQSESEEEEQEEALDRLSEKQSTAESAAAELEEQQEQPEQSQSEEERQAELDERNQEAAAEVESERQEQAARENGGAIEGGGGDDGDGEGPADGDGDEEGPTDGDGDEEGPIDGDGDADGLGDEEGEGRGSRPKNW